MKKDRGKEKPSAEFKSSADVIKALSDSRKKAKKKKKK